MAKACNLFPCLAKVKEKVKEKEKEKGKEKGKEEMKTEEGDSRTLLSSN